MQTEADVRSQLDRMEVHWEWLSRYREQMDWEITRVRLTQSLSANAFPGWYEYRAEVIRLARQKVDPSRYDLDGDGVMDSVWIIASDQGAGYPYMTGGSARVDKANTFVDAQSSQSVREGRTGNFNHELGHNLGLPDLYGKYETIGALSIMAGSWDLPPNDFTAFDRMKLGWVKPIVVDTTTSGLTIESANSHFFAVKLPTALPYEYFLLEYRQRPTSGLGSAGPPYDGVVVYHVLEFSNQASDPPLLKVEPADGVITTGRGPELTDLLYTGNPVMRLPMELRPYYSNEVAYTIDRVVSNHYDAVLLDITARSMPRVPNEVTNSSFETSSSPWTSDGWKPGSATFSWANGVGHESAHSLSISSSVPNDVEWRTTVTGLTPGVPHALCGYLRGQNIVSDQGSTRGASMSISETFIHSPSGVGTFDWTPFCTTFTPDSTSSTIACRLGGFGALASGTMWCDDVAVIPPLRSAF